MNKVIEIESSSANRKRRARERRRKRLAGIGTFLIVLTFIYLFMASYSPSLVQDFTDGFKTFFKMGGYPCQLSEGSFVSADAASKALCVLSDKTITVVKGGGAKLLEEYHGISAPTLAVNGNRVLVYSNSGKSYKIYNRTSLISEGITEGTIVSADVSSKGKVVLLMSHDAYACELKVLNKNTTDRFSWFGSDGFPLAVYASDTSDKVAVVCLKADSGVIRSVITVLDLGKQKELYSVTADGVALSVVLGNERLTAVFEDRAENFTNNGTSTAVYSFGNREVMDISVNSAGTVAVALGDNKRCQLNRVVVLSYKLETKYVVECGIPIKGIVLSSDRLNILSTDKVFVYNNNGLLKATYDTIDGTLAIADLGGPVAVSTTDVKKLTANKEEKA